MSGINSAVIAYGQTGTGKTFTMLGDSAFAEGKITNFGQTTSDGPLSPQLRPRATSAADLMGSQRMSMLESQAKDVEKSESAGLIPRIMRALFDNLLSTQQDFTVRASYIEIYMEMVKVLRITTFHIFLFLASHKYVLSGLVVTTESTCF
jgi:hypothetical protein